MRRLNIGRLVAGRPAIVLGYLIVVMIWGTTWYGVQTQVNGTAPHLAVALRLGAASLFFFAIAAIMRQPLRLSRRQLGLVVIQGVCFFGFNYIAVYTASQYITSGVLAVLFSVTVPFNIVADRMISGTRASTAVVFAALIGVAGIALVFTGELEAAFRASDALFAAGLAVAAAAVVAVGNVLAARYISVDIGAIRLNAFGLAAGTLLILLWGFASGAEWELNATPRWLAGWAYLTIIGSVVAFGIYIKILPAIGPVAGAYVVVLSPVLALAISAVLEDLSVGVASIAGIVLLLTGHSILVLDGRRNRQRVKPEPDPELGPAAGHPAQETAS